ncbi:nuclear GTPase SLIP-GC [Corynascus novoguineensis]|uniref:Nuclear GTPase SLIP-GC n=1 Tax=Corynascus novoguineensis TaxID=1126955 RepID=A0AAN7CR69_9PEZI|nr:nuclear GTPase SLIP-GC [Corynascus novoguineensis]
MAGLRAALSAPPCRAAPKTPPGNRSPLFHPPSGSSARYSSGREGKSLSPKSELEPEPRLSPSPSPFQHRRSPSQARQRPHQVSDEESPETRSYDTGFERAVAAAKSVAEDLARVLSHGDHPSLGVYQDWPKVRGYRDVAEKLAQFRCSPTLTVGLVGDSGVGKSSLLNSLLGVKLAWTNNGGEACTCVVTEYLYHDRDDYIVEVVPFSQDELRKQLAEMVHGYCHYHRHCDSAALGSDSDSDDIKYWEEKAAQARDSFQAMFQNRFSPDLIQSGRSEEDILETLISWSQEMGPTDIQSRQEKRETKECSNLVKQLTSSAPNSRGATNWRYIKKIRVFLRASVLSRGLVLVDLPGLRDLNSARRNVTERYLIDKCDEIFAVCRIDRAATDQGVADVFKLSRQSRALNVSIVCTRSEEINPEEAVEGFFDEGAAILQQHLDLAEDVKRQLATIEGRQLDYLDEFQEYGRAQSEEEQATQHQLRCEELAIKLRKEDVKNRLNRKYADQTPPENDLRVFCVSNKLYRSWRGNPADNALLHHSDIPDLRRHCLGLASEGRFRLAMRYVHGDVPKLVSEVETWTMSSSFLYGGPANTARTVGRALEELETRLRRANVYQRTHAKQSSRCISSSAVSDLLLCTGRQTREWTERAVRAGIVWNGVTTDTYAACCRKYGTHTTNERDHYDWNEEAMAAMSGALSPSWRTFDNFMDDHIRKLLRTLRNSLDWAVSHLETIPHGYGPDFLQPLLQTLKAHRRVLVDEVEIICENFRDKLRTLRADALGSHRTSFYGRGVEDAYNRAISECGKGSWARKKSIINAALRNEQLFEAVMRKLKDGFEGLAAALQADVQAAVGSDLNSIRNTLDIVRNGDAALPSEEELAFRSRVAEEIRGLKQRLDLIKFFAVERG